MTSFISIYLLDWFFRRSYHLCLRLVNEATARCYRDANVTDNSIFVARMPAIMLSATHQNSQEQPIHHAPAESNLRTCGQLRKNETIFRNLTDVVDTNVLV